MLDTEGHIVGCSSLPVLDDIFWVPDSGTIISTPAAGLQILDHGILTEEMLCRLDIIEP